jgi:hypothetical protein
MPPYGDVGILEISNLGSGAMYFSLRFFFKDFNFRIFSQRRLHKVKIYYVLQESSNYTAYCYVQTLMSEGEYNLHDKFNNPHYIDNKNSSHKHLRSIQAHLWVLEILHRQETKQKCCAGCKSHTMYSREVFACILFVIHLAETSYSS